MPTISIFYGIVIRMFWQDHSPPHFHAEYAGYGISVSIQTLEVLSGEMPKRPLSLILEWASGNRAALLEDWELCMKRQAPKKIDPLD